MGRQLLISRMTCGTGPFFLLRSHSQTALDRSIRLCCEVFVLQASKRVSCQSRGRTHVLSDKRLLIFFRAVASFPPPCRSAAFSLPFFFWGGSEIGPPPPGT